MTELPEIRASDAEREHAVARLREAAAEGRLTLEEFTERMHTAFETRMRADLEQLVRDLPEQAREPVSVPTVPRRRGWIVSVMGNTTRRGRWRVAEQTNAVALMGNATIDLCEAVLSAPEVEITVFCCMGNTHVIVPAGVEVDLSAVAIMGNKFDHRSGAPQPGAPVVRIAGLVLMGNLTLRSSGRSGLPLEPPPGLLPGLPPGPPFGLPPE